MTGKGSSTQQEDEINIAVGFTAQVHRYRRGDESDGRGERGDERDGEE